MTREPWSAAEPQPTDVTRLVTRAIRIEGSRSRSEIVERTGLSRAVVSQRVAELLKHGLVTEAGTGPSTGGRRPRQLRFASHIGRIVAADLGATSIDVAILDLSATVIHHVGEDADIAAGPEVVLGRVEELIDSLLAIDSDSPPVWGIGIGVPGPVEFEKGQPVSPPIMPGWDRYPIRQRMEDRYGAPTWVDNDVNLMAMGEWRKGVAQGHQNVVWLKIGTGIGAGIISDGDLHRGAQGAAGDVGHVQMVEDGVVCRCGNIGCLEAIAGGGALARDAETAARSGRSPWLANALTKHGRVDARTVANGSRHGDQTCVELLQRSARFVGHMTATLVNTLNPSLVVVGGGVAEAGDLYLASIRETVYRRSLPLATRDLQIVGSTIGRTVGVVGAACMVADALFEHEGIDLPTSNATAADQQVPETGAQVARQNVAVAAS